MEGKVKLKPEGSLNGILYCTNEPIDERANEIAAKILFHLNGLQFTEARKALNIVERQLTYSNLQFEIENPQ
jgi:hypothetical protein